MQYVEVTGSRLIRGSAALLKGFVLRATSAAVVEFYDSTTDSGTLVFSLNVANATHEAQSFDGIPFNNGIYVKIVSGAVVGSIFVE